MTVDLDELVDDVDVEAISPGFRDEARGELRHLLANQCVPGPCGGAFLAAADGELLGHVADLELTLRTSGHVEARHEDTHESGVVGRIDLPAPPERGGQA